MKFFFVAGILLFGLLGVSPISGEDLGNGNQKQSQTTNAPLKAEIKLGTGVENREPTGTNETFSSDVTQVIGWTKIKGAREPVHVRHIWLYEGREQASVLVPVKSSSYRVWTRKAIQGRAGRWTFEIRDVQENVIASKDFEVAPPRPSN